MKLDLNAPTIINYSPLVSDIRKNKFKGIPTIGKQKQDAFTSRFIYGTSP